MRNASLPNITYSPYWGPLARVFFVCVFALLTSLVPEPATAEPDSEIEFRSDEHDLARFNGQIIDSVIIDNRNIYDTDSADFDKFVYKLINSVRIKTRARIVAQENLLLVGEKFSAIRAEETARNLRLRLTLYDAWVQVESLGNNRVKIRIVTIDQWSLAAGVDIGRDGNEERYNIGITERNLLGTGQYISFDYTFQSDEEDILTLTYTEPHLFGRKIRGDLSYFDGPSASGESFRIGRPYYDRLQTTSFDLAFVFSDGRRDIYEDTLRVANSKYGGEEIAAEAAYRFGGYYQKLKIGALYRYRFEETSGRDTLSQPSSTIHFPQDSLFHELGATIGWSDVDFIKTRRIDGFGYTEDFVLGIGTSIRLSRAFDPGFSDFVFDRAGFNIAYALHVGRSLILSQYERSYWFRGSSEFRRTALWVSRWYSRPTSFLTVVSRVRYFSDWRSDASNNLILGGESGVRGLDTYTRTGDRLVTATLEGRLFSGIELLSIGLGVAAFLDAGRVWRARDPVKFRDFLFAGGVGLRFEAARSSRTRLVRIDLAYSESVGWQLSLGTGQYFPSTNLSFP